MGRVVVRGIVDDDRDRRAMARLRRQWAEEDDGGPIDDPGYEARAVRWIAENRSHRLAWLAEVDGAPVGLVTVVVVDRMPQPGRPDSGWGYVHHFFVAPEHRGEGIGRRLMNAVVQAAADRGWAQLVLHPRTRSRSFYRRAGFTTADRLMVRRLDS